MARSLDGSSHYLRRATAVLGGVPLTVAGWVRTSSTAAGPRSVVSITDGAEILNGWWLRVEAGGTLSAYTGNSVATAAGTIAGVTVDTWHHVAGVFASTTSRVAYLNGVAGSVEATDITPSSLSETDVGVYNLNNGPGQYFWLGSIGEVGIWNAALSASDIQRLAQGWSPLLVRRANLVAYWPLVGGASPEPDQANGLYPLIVSGASVSALVPPMVQTQTVGVRGGRRGRR